jgi:hypothetical protein
MYFTHYFTTVTNQCQQKPTTDPFLCALFRAFPFVQNHLHLHLHQQQRRRFWRPCTTLNNNPSVSSSHPYLRIRRLTPCRQSFSAVSLLAMADTPHTKCSHCFQPASLQCSACKTHVYCHSECQRRNWSTHKILCKKARLELAVCRAADIFASIYFAFREKIFDRVIVKIEGKPGGLRVWEDDTAVKKSGWFAEFPDNLTEDPNVKAAVLFFQVCSEPYGYLKEVIDLLFEGKSFWQHESFHI